MAKQTTRRRAARSATEQHTSRSRIGLWRIAAVIALAAAGVGALVAMNAGGGDDTPSMVVRPADSLGDIPQQGKTLGDPDAPVTLTVYSDFLCPHCREFVEGAERRVIADYVAPGAVRIEYRHFPVFGEGAVQAAAASECAAQEGRFWQYHDVVFANQAFADGDGFGIDRLVEFAGVAELDGDTLRSCLESGATADAVASDAAQGEALGVSGTPALFVNGARVPGNDEEAVVGAIERALAG